MDEKRPSKLSWPSGVFRRYFGVLTVAVAGPGATLFVQAKRLEQQRGAAADLFYAMKEMELDGLHHLARALIMWHLTCVLTCRLSRNLE